MEGLNRNFVRMSQHWVGSQVLEEVIRSHESLDKPEILSLELGMMIGDPQTRVNQLRELNSSRAEKVISAINEVQIPITPPMPTTPPVSPGVYYCIAIPMLFPIFPMPNSS